MALPQEVLLCYRPTSRLSPALTVNTHLSRCCSTVDHVIEATFEHVYLDGIPAEFALVSILAVISSGGHVIAQQLDTAW